MEYRDAVAADAEQIALLHAASWRRTYRGILRDEYLAGDVVEDRTAVWNGRLASPAADQFVRVAEEGGVVRGFACAFGDSDPVWGTLLDNIHVAHEEKRNGIGATLVRDVAGWTRERYPAAGLYLWVFEANREAQRFYRRIGASHVGTETTENPGGGTATTFRYAWSTLAPLIAGHLTDAADPHSS